MEFEASPLTEVPVNLAGSLGADAGVAVQCLTVYIPNKDKNDQEIGTQRRWVLDAPSAPLRDQWRRDRHSGRRGLAQRRRPDHPGTPGDRLFLRLPTGRVLETATAPAYLFAPHGPGDQSRGGRLRVRRPLLPHPAVRHRLI